MSIIPQITCRQCGTQYSALRGRCPNCGTPHVVRTTRSTTPDSDAGPTGEPSAESEKAAQWQLIFGGVLILAVIVAVIILISASLNPSAGSGKSTSGSTASQAVETPDVAVTPSPTPTLPPTATPEPTTAVSSITICAPYDHTSPLTDVTFRAGESFSFAADVFPVEAQTDAKINWRSTDETEIGRAHV